MCCSTYSPWKIVFLEGKGALGTEAETKAYSQGLHLGWDINKRYNKNHHV